MSKKINTETKCTCGTPLNGYVPTISTNEEKDTPLRICPSCLERTAQELREKTHTHQIIHTVVRHDASNEFGTPVFLVKNFYNKEKALKYFKELFEIDITQAYYKDIPEGTKNFKTMLEHDQNQYSYEIFIPMNTGTIHTEYTETIIE